jgi:hypothetical protein
VETISYADKRLLESRVQVNLHARFGEGALETQVKLCAGALLYNEKTTPIGVHTTKSKIPKEPVK